MEDVSDPPFRYVCKQHGADLMYTEFISSEGLIRDAGKSRQKLDIFDYERPIGIQIFGGDEEAMEIGHPEAEVIGVARGTTEMRIAFVDQHFHPCASEMRGSSEASDTSTDDGDAPGSRYRHRGEIGRAHV